MDAPPLAKKNAVTKHTQPKREWQSVVKQDWEHYFLALGSIHALSHLIAVKSNHVSGKNCIHPTFAWSFFATALLYYTTVAGDGWHTKHAILLTLVPLQMKCNSTVTPRTRRTPLWMIVSTSEWDPLSVDWLIDWERWMKCSTLWLVES